ncbi:hypothetical protein QL285_048781 [Trifolium repens]|nr:hypothetical protein QL285_048781 [Trifolium repens]
MNGNGGMSTKLPVFDGKNWNRWMKQMIVLFGAQDVLELVTEGYVPVAADATDAQKLAQKDTKKKDQRALFYIHQCVDENVFEKIADSETAKAAWDTLIRCYGGDASVKKVKLQSLRKQYENLNMKNNEKVPEYISRMILITNEMKACGETLSEQVIIEKVLRSLTPQFDYIVVAIEHSKDLSSMRVEELQSSLEAHELRMTERTSEREAEQALKASFAKKDQKQNRHGRAQMSEALYSDKKKYQKRKEKSDKKNVQCYCCKNFGHYANDCLLNKERESEEANMARSSDDEPVLLMAYESDDDEPVKLTFSDSEEVSEDDYEIGVRLYDSESESEVSEDESESEDDSEDEEVSKLESSEDESEDEGDSEGSDSEESDSEGSDSEGDSEGSEDEVSQGSEGGRTSDNNSDARASEGETSGSPTSEEEEFEGKSDSESDGGDDSDGASDSDPESSGDSDGGDQDSEDVGSGGQASEFDHAIRGNHDFEGGPSEGGASKGSPASNNGHVSKGETSEGRVSGSIQDSEGGASGVGCLASDTVPELEEDCDSGIDYGANSEVRSSEFVTIKEILEKQVWLQAMTEELEILRYDFLGPSGVKTNAELIDSDWSKDQNLRRGQVQNEVLEAAHCSAQKQLADALIKDVKAEHFIRLRDGIGVAEIEFAEYELRNGSASNSYSKAVRRRNFCGHYSEAVLLRSSRASEVISQKQKKKQKLKHKKKSKQKEKQKQKLKLKEKQKARSKQKLLMRIQKSKSLFNFWSVSLCVNIN